MPKTSRYSIKIGPCHASLVKDSYWRWPQRQMAGNAIDFFMRVLGLSFHDAMRQIASG